MSQLNLKTLRYGRVMTFVTKMEDGVKSQKPEYMFTKLDGRKVFLRTLQYSPGGRIQHFEIMKHKKQIVDLLNGASALPGLKFTDTSGNITVSLADLTSTEEFGGKSGRGDMAEMVYSAAITARFLNKETLIKPDDVEWVLRRIGPTNTHQRLGPWKTETEQKGVYDTVFWTFTAPIMTIKTLVNQFNRKQKDITTLIHNAVKYANSDIVKENIKVVSGNNKTNIIEILAEGTFASSANKIDVKVKIDNTFINLNAPVTATGASAQGGGSYAKQKELFKSLVGVEVSSGAVKDYTKDLGKGIPPAVFRIYHSTALEMNRRFKNLSDPIYTNLAKGIISLSTKTTVGLKVKPIPPSEYKLFLGGNLKTALEITNRRLKCESTMIGNLPYLFIKDTLSGKVFLQLKLERAPGKTEYYINVIEKGAEFDHLAKVLK